MTHISYLISLDPSNHEIEIAQLNFLGVESFIEHDNALEAFIESEPRQELERVVENYLKQKAFSYKKIIHNARDWNAEWESNFKPIAIDHTLVVRAPFHAIDPGYLHELIIAPKMAFGTGHHETTSMILEWMLSQDFIGKKVLDFGCGTGILGILAAKNGANEVCFMDNDPLAVENTIENIATNHLSPMAVKLGSYESIPDERFDFILANITRNILSEGLITFSNHLKSKAKIVMSGFLLEDFDFMNEKMHQAGLQFVEQTRKGDWLCIIAEKQ